MVLDAIVEDPDLVWLGTAEEKAAHLTALTRIEPADLPHVTVGEGDARTVRYFPDRLPIGIHLAGRGVVVYVVTDPWLDDFRVFLERHAALLRALPAWTLRIVVPPQFPDIGQRAKQVVWNQLLTPLKTEMLDELRWYFEQARAHPAPSRCRRPGRAVLPGSRRLLSTSIQGAVPGLEAGRRAGFRRLRIPCDRRRRDRRRGPCRDPRTRPPLRSSLPPGCRRLMPNCRRRVDCMRRGWTRHRSRLVATRRLTRRYSGVEQPMTQKVDAIYTDGVLKPTGELSLRENNSACA